jgi:hypothetical protein
MQVLFERNTLCQRIWRSGNPDVGLNFWTQEQKQRFLDVCTDTDIKARELQQWIAANLKNLELSEAKTAQDQYESQVRDFLSVQPNITMIVKKTHNNMSVTRKLDRSISIENRSNRPINVEFVEIYDPNVDSSLIGKRLASQSAYVKSEIERRVFETTKNLGAKLSINFLKTVRRVSGSGGRDITGFALVDDLQLKALESQIQSGDIIILSSFKAAEIVESAKAAQAISELKAKEDARLQSEIIQKLATSPTEFSAAILINTTKTQSVCMVQKSDNFPIRGYRVSKEFNETAGTNLADSFQVASNNLDELFKSIQNKQCHALILQNGDMQKLLAGVKELKIDYKLLPSKSALELSQIFVMYLGFKDFSQYQFSQTIGSSSAGINRLADLGVTSVSSYNAAVKQMNDSRYSSSKQVSDVIDYLEDAQEGKRSNKSAVQVRQAREQMQAQVEKARTDKLIKDLPKYRIVARCLAPADRYTETLMNMYSNSPALFINALNAQSKFCFLIDENVTNIDLIKSASLIARGQNGAEFYVARTAGGNASVGIVKQP